MFIHWKKKPLADSGYTRLGTYVFDTCTHDLSGPARVKLTPVLKESYRGKEGRPRHRTLWNPGPGIRPCCLEDLAYPMVRVGFWIALAERFGALEQDRRAPHRRMILESRAWLEAELAKRVLPGADPPRV